MRHRPHDPTRRALVLGVPLALALAACTREPDPKAGLANRREGPITFALAGPDVSVGRQQVALARRWEEEAGGSQRVEVVELTAGADQQRSELAALLQDGRGFDVLSLDVAWMTEFARFGYLRSLPAAELDAQPDSTRFLRRPLESCWVDEQLWAVPYTTNAGLLYRNLEVLGKLGRNPDVPVTSWRHLQTLAEATGEPEFEGGVLDGYVTQLANYEGLTVNVLEAVWDAGGDIVTEDGEVTAAEPEAVAGLARLVEGLAGGWIPRSALGFREEESRLEFQKGQVLFMRNWPYAYRALNAPGAPLAGLVEVGKLPGPSALGGQNLAISRNAANQGTALGFIKFMVREDNQQQLFGEGGFPSVLQSVYDDAEVRRAHPYTGLLRASVESARQRPRTPYAPWVSEAIAHHASLALQGTTTPDQAMRDLARVLERTLSRV